MMRIGIAQIWQESNSFNPCLTERADFEALRCGTGAQGLKEAATGEEVLGFVEGMRDWSDPAEPVGLVMAQAWPGGPLSRETREWFGAQLDSALREAGPLNGLLVSLHGSLVAEDEPDADGWILELIRSSTGNTVPIVATIDLHASMTARMVREADCILAYHTNPHLDRSGTGRRAAHVLDRILHGARPVSRVRRIPMMTSGEMTRTDELPLRPLFQRIRDLEARSEVLSSAILMAQPWLDVAGLSWTILLTTDGVQAGLTNVLEGTADDCWQIRHEMRPVVFGARESVQRALGIEGGPVVIADGADATNSGACGDSVHLLAELIERRIPGRALSIMVDPDAVAHAVDIGADGTFRFAVGGKRDHRFSCPLEVVGTVQALKPARYVLSGHLGDTLSIDMGVGAIVRFCDVDLLLVERPGPGSSPLMYRCVGLEPRDYKIVIVKSPAGFRAEFEPIAAGIVLSACPGCASPLLEEMPYRNLSRPVWPLDSIESWREVAWVRALDSNDSHGAV